MITTWAFVLGIKNKELFEFSTDWWSSLLSSLVFSGEVARGSLLLTIDITTGQIQLVTVIQHENMKTWLLIGAHFRLRCLYFLLLTDTSNWFWWFQHEIQNTNIKLKIDQLRSKLFMVTFSDFSLINAVLDILLVNSNLLLQLQCKQWICYRLWNCQPNWIWLCQLYSIWFYI